MKKILFALFVFISFSINAFAAVNINTATQAELESLNGIGPVKAKAIIDYRKKNGDFKSVDDLEKVDGVGKATLSNLRKDVSVSGKTTAITEVKPVGNTKAATSGKTADSKEVKASTDKKPAKKEAASKTEVKADAKAADVKVKTDTKADSRTTTDTKSKK